jgi:MraZ protein
VEENPQPVRLKPPRGIFPARCDDKGRVKLPASFKAYLEQLGEKDLFVTSFDGRIGRIYTDSAWEKSEKHLSADGDGFERRQWMYRWAMVYGADSKLDDQGRVLVNPELRRAMGIENQPVKLMFFDNVIQLWSDAADAEDLADAKKLKKEDILAEQMRGLR